MKKKYFILLILFALTFVFTIVSDYAFLPDNRVEKLPTDNKDIYYGSEKINLSNLNDPLFADSEYSYNHKLAVESLKLAISSFSSNVSDTNWGENKNIGREDNVKKSLAEYGFSNIHFFGYDAGLNDFSSKAAFAIAEKVYNHDTSVIAIVIRGGNYGLEWADNFNIGNSRCNYHLGFYNAALDIKSKVDKMLPQLTQNKNLKFWITGYSRGGAIANILASMYNNNKSSFPCQVYAYTLASPRVAVVSATSAHDTIYRNIFNILSPNDPIYNIPPDKWDFGRFGICVIFPNNNDLSFEGASALNRKVAKTYYNYTGETLVTSGETVNSFINIIIKSSESRDFFSDNLSGPVSDLIKIKMSKHKNSNGLWQNYKRDDILQQMYGKEAVDTLKKIKNGDFFVTLKKIGVILPEDFYTFITLCHINGFTKYEDALFSNINVQDMSDISYITSNNLISAGHRTEFYLSWLENVSVSNLKFSKE